MKRALVVASMLSATLAWVPVSAHASTIESVLAKFSFDGAGSAVLDVEGAVTTSTRSVLVMTDVDRSNPASSTVLTPQVLDLRQTQDLETYGIPGRRSICAPPMQCNESADRVTFQLKYKIDGGSHRSHIDVYLAVRGLNISMHNVKIVGWRERVMKGAGVLTTRNGDEGSGTGVNADGSYASVMSGGTAGGQAHGSVGLAVPPCDSVGVGSVTLAGGQQPQTATCPSGVLGAVATHSTMWKLTGPPVGVADNKIRLAVFPR